VAAGVTADATTIYLYDDSNGDAGGDGSYSFADIFAKAGIGGVDFLRVDSGTGFPTYRALKNIQIGDATAGTATTSLIDNNVVVNFDAGKVLKMRTTQTTSWRLQLGTKVGSGAVASGKKSVGLYFHNYSASLLTTTNGTTLLTSAGLFGSVAPGMSITGADIPGGTTVSIVTNSSNLTMSAAATGSSTVNRTIQNGNGTNNVVLRGDVALYGCSLVSSSTSGQALQFLSMNSGAGDLVNCLFQGFTATLSAHSFGAVGAPVSNLFNVDISGDPAQAITGAFVPTTASRLTFSGNPGTSYVTTGSLVGIQIKDCIFFGTPAASDMRWGSPTATNWALIRPTWSGNAAKWSGSGPTTPSSGAQEYWNYDAKVVNGLGMGVSGIPLKLTDNDGNVQVSVVTDANGEISFGSGLTANIVAVMDHYSDGTPTYLQHHRSPFLCEVNMPTQAGYNNSYLSRRYYFNWPGKETVTTTAGSFVDLGDIINIQDPPGQPTSWVEASL